MLAEQLRLALHPSHSRRPEVSIGALHLGLLVWLPLVVIGLTEHIARGRPEPVLLDLAVHARLLIALPFLPIVDALLARRQAEALTQLVDEGFVPQHAVVRRLAAGLERWASGSHTQIVLAILAIATAQLFYWGVLSTTGLAVGERLARPPHGPAGSWYAWVALPLFYFVLLRVLWRWVLWIGVLIRLAHLPLRLASTHPDRAGGIAFLTRPSVVFSGVSLLMGAVLAASWGTAVVRHGSDAVSYHSALVLWVFAVLVVTLGPLAVFTPQLVRVRWEGRIEHGRLATIYSRRYWERWGHGEPSPAFLGSPDILALSDIGHSFELIEKTRLVPFGASDALRLIGLSLAPMIPLVVSIVPITELASDFLHALV